MTRDTGSGRDLIVLGAGGHGREHAWLAREQQRVALTLRGYADDDPALHGRTLGGLTVLTSIDALNRQQPEAQLALGVGAPRVKRAIVARLGATSERFPMLIHPSAVVADSAKLEGGVTIAALSVVSVDTRLGSFTSLNVHVAVGHDTHIGCYVTINPGARIAGSVRIDDGVEVGLGASIRQGIRVHEGAVIGAGAVVVADVPANAVVAGVPAREMRRAADW